jgi:drug/metabolite transporter superfamily protein YnfA
MTIWQIIGGAILLIFGILLYTTFLVATGLSVGFGGTSIPGAWFLLPAIVTFGGPYLLWFWLPKRRRAKRSRSANGSEGDGR